MRITLSTETLPYPSVNNDSTCSELNTGKPAQRCAGFLFLSQEARRPLCVLSAYVVQNPSPPGDRSPLNNHALELPQLFHRKMHSTILPPEVDLLFICHRPYPRRLEIGTDRKVYVAYLQRLEIGTPAEAGDVHQVNDHPVSILAPEVFGCVLSKML